MARLVLLQGGQAIPLELKEPETILGRLPECTYQLDSNMVSRRHARFTCVDGQWQVEDLGSGNGTFVNSQRLDPESPAPLKQNDRVKFGPVLLRFEDAHASPMPTVPAGDSDNKPLGKTEPPGSSDPFQLQIQKGDDDSATVMGTVSNVSGFGLLDVRPEAKLKAVLEISRSLAGTLEIEKLLPKLLDTLFAIFPSADRGCVLLQNEHGEMVPAAQKHRRPGEDQTVKLSSTVLDMVKESKSGVLSADTSADLNLNAAASISNLSIRSLMCAPMLSVDREVLGVVNLDSQNPLHQFKEEDLDLLLAVAGQAALTYESARLLHSYMQKQKQDNELDIATKVQQALLPDELPVHDNYQFWASYEAAQAVGGDYYDWFDLGDGRLALSFGDVAGKGVPGALIMSRMATVVQTTLQFVQEAGPAVLAINERMCTKAVEGRFVTYVLAILDTNTHELSLVNAGHGSPIIRKPDETIELFDEESIGLPIGITDGFPYDVVTRTIEPGEVVVITTDGVEDAMNPEDHRYTADRANEFIRTGPSTAAELGQALFDDVRAHASGRDQNDDITIMTFGRNP